MKTEESRPQLRPDGDANIAARGDRFNSLRNINFKRVHDDYPEAAALPLHAGMLPDLRSPP